MNLLEQTRRWALYRKSRKGNPAVLIGCFESTLDYALLIQARAGTSAPRATYYVCLALDPPTMFRTVADDR